MTEDEVDFIIRILEAGSLPAALNPDPISEEVISSTLGHETIEKGKFAIGVSLIAVLVFMAIYYRFAGIIACLALLTNLLLVLGVMVLINAALTLPGLAGLVLTVGMSVDANVLIFERIREELSRGAALRMAIRNGFGRATTTIVDANITTLITGVVLYAIGTDQLRGFAVTLILGILMSMYTAIFCSRVIFDIAERRRWITQLNMSHVIGETNFDFIGKRYVAGGFSLLVIVLGLMGVWQRGAEILNIDFTGGTSVTMVLNDESKMPFTEVNSAIRQTELADKNLTVVERGTTSTRYTITSTAETVAEVQQLLGKVFAGKLKTYHIEVENLSAGDDGGTVAELVVNDGPGYDEEPGAGHDSMLARLTSALEATGHEGLDPTLTAPGYQPGSAIPSKNWTVNLELEPDEARSVLDLLASNMNSRPMYPLSNKIGGKVAGNMQVTACYAILVSLLGIVGYLWLRFQKVTFGLAAVLALVHDVLITLGMIALSAYVVSNIPALAHALQIDAFQISLPIVAAFLTIIGYSLNDTIVIFDRIREVRGKSPQLTAEMINTSINQTLSRTLLTSVTTLLVVVILYFFGGAGIHDFAFSLVVGVIAGTYSTVFVASPALLAMSGTASSPASSKAG
jgi:SecD/SecF fusion protein